MNYINQTNVDGTLIYDVNPFPAQTSQIRHS